MKKTFSPYLLIIISFITLILIGTLLLLLPSVTTSSSSLSLIDAFFLATSSVTITGISTVSNLATLLSPFGKVILVLLIKMGGLSLITVSVFIMALIGVKIGISNRVLLKENLGQANLKGLVKLVKWIFITSFIIELIGAIINFLVFRTIFTTNKAIAVSIVESIVAFNNAGFDLMGVNDILMLNTYPLYTINTLLLVVLGGIGFVVIFDIINTRSYKKLTLHSKIVIKVNLFLWVFGFLMFKLGSNLTFFQSLFLSVNARSAGFPINIGILPNHGLLILMLLMMIGASPASTGSGIKTTTFYVLGKSFISFAKGSETTSSNRLISKEIKYKAFILLIAVISIIIFAATLLLMFQDVSLEVALHEVIAALSNAGINSGLIYNIPTKLLIIILMFVGRVGILTTIALFNSNWYKPINSNIKYIEEKIMIG